MPRPGCDCNAFSGPTPAPPSTARRSIGSSPAEPASRWPSEGCREFASDAEPGNQASAAAHGAVGFTEVGLVRCFRKDL